MPRVRLFGVDKDTGWIGSILLLRRGLPAICCIERSIINPIIGVINRGIVRFIWRFYFFYKNMCFKSHMTILYIYT